MIDRREHRQRHEGVPAPLLAFAIALGVGSVGAGCQATALAPPPAAPQAHSAQPLRLRGVQAKAGKLERSRLVHGRLAPWQRVVLSAPMDAMIVRLPVELGDRVAAGAVLAQLQVPGLASLQIAASAAVEAAKRHAGLQADLARRTQRAARLDAAAVADQEVGASASARDSAEARARAADAERARLLELSATMTITAPWAGVVEQRHREPGAHARAGAALVTLVRDDVLRLQVRVPEGDLALAARGAVARCGFPTLAAAARSCEVARVAPSLQPGQATRVVELDLSNPDASLVIGARVEVHLQGRDDGVPGVLLPSEALLREGADTVVYVARDGRATRRVVQVRFDNGRDAELAAGLEPGDVALLGGRGLLRDGDDVEVAR